MIPVRLQLQPWDDLDAMLVFKMLDVNDFAEAEAVRGRRVMGLGLWADWRAIEAARVMSFVAYADDTPFAVMGLANTGQAGVAEAALLARSHHAFRRALARLGRAVRARLPAVAAEIGLHRVEARCSSDHPTASGFLAGCGFVHEADMPGFGPGGGLTFRQFARVFPASSMETTDVPVQRT